MHYVRTISLVMPTSNPNNPPIENRVPSGGGFLCVLLEGRIFTGNHQLLRFPHDSGSQLPFCDFGPAYCTLHGPRL